MSFDIETERKQFVITARISSATYTTDDRIGKRTRRIFKTFARALHGRGYLPESEKETEISNLVHVMRREVIDPLLSSPTEIAGSQNQFDNWHRKAIGNLKADYHVRWDYGSNLTVGMAQKLINLHCKDLWALDLIPENYSRFFHPIIDRVTLGMLRRRVSWTTMDSYEEYMQLQFEFRQVARHQDTYPLALECWYWNRNNKRTT